MRRSDSMIDTLIAFTVNTGLITFSAATLHVVFFVASRGTGVKVRVIRWAGGSTVGRVSQPEAGRRVRGR